MLIHIFAIMKLEDQIKQASFSHIEEKLIVNLIYTSNLITLLTSRLFKPYGLSAQQYNVLRILRGQNGQAISLLDIEDRMLDKSSNVSRLIDKLVLKHYITREESKVDRRRVDVLISQSGLDVLKEIDAELNKFYEKLNTLVEYSDAKKMNTILDTCLLYTSDAADE